VKLIQILYGLALRRVDALSLAFALFHVGCAHMEGTDSLPKSTLETAVESILKERAGKNLESVKCVESECTFEYSALDETEAAKIANSVEADLAAKGFAGIKINATESLSSGLLRSVFFGLGMGLAAAIFGAL
jgi:hypothetical protein